MRLLSVVVRGLAFAAVAAVPTPGTAAPPAPDKAVLYLRAGDVNTRAAADARTQPGPRTTGGAQRYVLQLDGPITPRRRAALERTGIQLGDYLPMNAYLARLTADDVESLDRVPFVQWVGLYRADWKIDPVLTSPAAPAARTRDSADTVVQVVICLFADSAPEPVAARLSGIGATVINVSRPGRRAYIDALVPRSALAGLAHWDEVQFIEPAPQGILRNDSNRWIAQSNVEDFTPVWDAGLHGEGELVGLIDDPMDLDHCAFADDVDPGPTHRKVYAYRGTPTAHLHGTHVAGTLAGDYENLGQPDTYDGLALAARITYSDVNEVFDAPSTFYDRLLDAYNDGARLHNNSWGAALSTYIVWSEQADRFSREHEDALLVVAVANDGTVLAPENAKNVLAVTASDDTPNQGNHCSGAIGPTFDNRRRPEVCAPGCYTRSAYAGRPCSWVANSGTSMACPVVTAAGVLTRQYFIEGFYPTGAATPGDALQPSGALLKACLINSAADLTGVEGYPSDLEGWGRVLLDDVLYFEGDDRNLCVHDLPNDEGLSTGDEAGFDVEVVGAAEPLRVTLVWTDVPALEGTSFAPVNDLDLAVTAPDGQAYLGNVFDQTIGQSQTGGTADNLNNTEQVHLLTPPIGQYRISVVGTAVNQETQGFALVITGALAGAGPSIEALRSCLTHGAAGEFCLNLDADNSIEPRQLGVTKIELELSEDLAPATVTAAAVEVNCAQAGTYSGHITASPDGARGLIVAFAPALPDQDCCTIAMPGITTARGASVTARAKVRTLRGDVDRNGLASMADASQIKPKYGKPTGAANFIFDFNASGRVGYDDFAAVIPTFGDTAPACP